MTFKWLGRSLLDSGSIFGHTTVSIMLALEKKKGWNRDVDTCGSFQGLGSTQ